MEFIKKFKVEIIIFFVFSGLSVLYYLDTGEVKIMGVLVLLLLLFSAIIRICEKMLVKLKVKVANKNT